MTPRISWQNVLEQATSIVATSQAAGYPAVRVADGFPFNRWKPAGVVTASITATFTAPISINHWCCYGHNLGLVGATIRLRTSTNGGSTWNSYGATISPVGSEPLYVVGTSRQANALRWTITPASGVPEIGILQAGVDLVMPVGLQPGWTPPRDAQVAKMLEAVSRTGMYLGSTIERIDAEVTCRFRDVDEDWVRLNWRPFMARAQSRPFFLHWDTDLDPEGAAFCSGAEFKPVSYGAPGLMDLEVTARAGT